MKYFAIFLLIIICYSLNEHRTLQGALKLMEITQIQGADILKEQSNGVKFVTYIEEQLEAQLGTITDNKLSKNYPIFNSLPLVLCLAAIIPILIVVVFSYGAFKLIEWSLLKESGKSKYTKLPQKKNEQPQSVNKEFDYYSEGMAFCFM